mgnify:CR=1
AGKKPLMNKEIGIGGINAANIIANNKIVLFSITFTSAGTSKKALIVDRTYMPRYEASIIDLNSQKYVFIYIWSELPMPQLTAINKYPKKKIK